MEAVNTEIVKTTTREMTIASNYFSYIFSGVAVSPGTYEIDLEVPIKVKLVDKVRAILVYYIDGKVTTEQLDLYSDENDGYKILFEFDGKVTLPEGVKAIDIKLNVNNQLGKDINSYTEVLPGAKLTFQ